MTSKMQMLLGSVSSCLLLCAAAPAFAQATPALSGQVSSAGAPMEGVLVSATGDGSTITTTVVTNAKGEYSFPSGRLAAGAYSLAIRAVGYDLQGPQTADVVAGKDTTANLTLVKTKDLEAQLSNAEWLQSFPVPNKQKAFLTNCVDCHTLARPADSNFTQGQFPAIIDLMETFSAESVPTQPQLLPPGPRARVPSAKVLAADSKVLSEINLSQGPKRSYPLKTMPRPTGAATKVIITTYKIPFANWEPHDVILDNSGNIWFSDFGRERVGEMDPKTGKVTVIPLPLLKPGATTGSLDLEKGPQGNIWVAMMYQGGIAKVDDKTHVVTTYKIPQKYQNYSTQESFVSPEHSNVDGYVWTNDQDQHSLIRLDLKTGKFGPLMPEKDAKGVTIPAYQIPTNLENNVYLLNFGGTRVGYVSKANDYVATGFNTPSPYSRPRRGGVDSKDRLWFAEYGANRIGMFDPKTKQITEWVLPTPWSDPYDVQYSSKFDEVWAGSMLSDRVDRLNVKTGEFTEYLLPKDTNIRRVYLDSRGPRPVLWVGNNHGAEVIKVEPLD